jgi:3-methylfumaryl-CoA hydratase
MTPTELEQLLPHWRTWIGRRESRSDTVTAAPLAGLAATLDRDDPAPQPGSEAPPLSHWLYGLPQAPQRELGDDGHPRRGGFLPPVPLPRRLWAGGRLVFHHALCVGDAIRRDSQVLSVNAKTGRSGPLVFVTVRHEIHNARGLALSEEHDIVYRGLPSPGREPVDPAAAPPGPADAGEPPYSRRISPDPVLLFRYSALTFNGHRIHYDRRHCEQVEGYPGLVVHGPLQATLLADLLRRQHPQARLRRFDFTALRPLFDTQDFELCGQDLGAGRHRLWTRDAQGCTAMRAEAHTA